MTAPVGCFGACSSNQEVKSLEFALKQHNSLMAKATKDITTVGTLKKSALEQAISLRQQGGFITHTATHPQNVKYSNFVNNEIKDPYRSKLEKLESRLRAHATYLNGHEYQARADKMVRAAAHARTWAEVHPEDREAQTTFTVEQMEAQHKLIDQTLQNL